MTFSDPEAAISSQGQSSLTDLWSCRSGLGTRTATRRSASPGACANATAFGTNLSARERTAQRKDTEMKQYDVFESEGGFRVAGKVYLDMPVMSESPWYKHRSSANRAAKRMRERDEQWLYDHWDEYEKQKKGTK